MNDQPPPSPLSRTTIAVVHNPAPVDADDDDRPPSFAAVADIVETADHVAAVLGKAGFRVERHVLRGAPVDMAEELAARGIDLVFNLVEEVDGEAAREWELPHALQPHGVACTGSPPDALRTAQRKDVARAVLTDVGVPVPRGVTLWTAEDRPDFPAPWFVKAATADGSLGVDAGSLVHDEAALAERVAYLLRHFSGPVVAEEYLPGAELNVALLPGGKRLRASTTAIDFSDCPHEAPRFVTYDCKWTPGSPEYAARSVDARTLATPAQIRAAERAAITAFEALGGSGYGRVDLRLDATGKPHVIDVNPNPDLHPEAGFAIAASLVGMAYPDLVRAIAERAWTEKKRGDSTDRARRSRAARRAAGEDRQLS